MDPRPALWCYRTDSVEPIASLEGLESDSAVSDDGRIVVATDGNSTPRVVDLESGQVLRSIDLRALREPTHFEWLAIKPIGTLVASGNRLESIDDWTGHRTEANSASSALKELVPGT